MYIFSSKIKIKPFSGLYEAWTARKPPFSTFYFYFWRRKTNDESRYLSGFRFLFLLFSSQNQHWITVCKLISILILTFSAAKPNVEDRKTAFISILLLLFSAETRRRKKAIPDFYFFLGSKLVPKNDLFRPKPVFWNSHGTSKMGFRAPLRVETIPGNSADRRNRLDPISKMNFF